MTDFQRTKQVMGSAYDGVDPAAQVRGSLPTDYSSYPKLYRWILLILDSILHTLKTIPKAPPTYQVDRSMDFIIAYSRIYGLSIPRWIRIAWIRRLLLILMRPVAARFRDLHPP